MTKKKKNIFSIFAEAIGLYFSNFRQFFKYMSFPIWGQIVGFLIIIGTTVIFSKCIPSLITKYQNLDNWSSLILMSIAVTIPGLIIFLKAFWEYLVAYGAINSMVDNAIKSGKVYDFPAHTELIKRRTPAFVGIWLVVSIISLFAICPFFSIICGIFGIYFILVFQVFTFEPELSVFGCFKRSLSIIKGHFASTSILLILIGALTYWVIPQIFSKIIELANIGNILTFNLNLSDYLSNTFPQLGLKLTEQDILQIIIQSVIAQIVIQYTLPLRSILWSLWYKELSNNTAPAIKTETKKKRKSKRPSEKLMESSHKKYSKTKIDSNILRRAMEKDEG